MTYGELLILLNGFGMDELKLDATVFINDEYFKVDDIQIPDDGVLDDGHPVLEVNNTRG